MSHRTWTQPERVGLLVALLLLAAGPLVHVGWGLADPRLRVAAADRADLDPTRRYPLDPWGQPLRRHLNDHVTGDGLSGVLRFRAVLWRDFARHLRQASARPDDVAFAEAMERAADRELASERQLRARYGAQVDDPTFKPYADSYERRHCHHRPVVGECFASYSYGPNRLDDLGGGDDVLAACLFEPYYTLYAGQPAWSLLLGVWLAGLIVLARVSATSAGRPRDLAESALLGLGACLPWALTPSDAGALSLQVALAALASVAWALGVWACGRLGPTRRGRAQLGLGVLALGLAAWLARDVAPWREAILPRLSRTLADALFPWDHPWSGLAPRAALVGLACGWLVTSLALHLLRLQHQPRSPELLHALRERPTQALRVVGVA